MSVETILVPCLTCGKKLGLINICQCKCLNKFCADCIYALYFKGSDKHIKDAISQFNKKFGTNENYHDKEDEFVNHVKRQAHRAFFMAVDSGDVHLIRELFKVAPDHIRNNGSIHMYVVDGNIKAIREMMVFMRPVYM